MEYVAHGRSCGRTQLLIPPAAMRRAVVLFISEIDIASLALKDSKDLDSCPYKDFSTS
jgi:hypothetical protein